MFSSSQNDSANAFIIVKMIIINDMGIYMNRILGYMQVGHGKWNNLKYFSGSAVTLSECRLFSFLFSNYGGVVPVSNITNKHKNGFS